MKRSDALHMQNLITYVKFNYDGVYITNIKLASKFVVHAKSTYFDEDMDFRVQAEL